MTQKELHRVRLRGALEALENVRPEVKETLNWFDAAVERIERCVKEIDRDLQPWRMDPPMPSKGPLS